MKFRVPGWARNKVLPGDLYQYATVINEKNKISLNGEEIDVQAEDGYFAISREWTKGDMVELEFPMEVRKVKANQLVAENKDKMSLEYGPIVYAVEEMDNKGDFEKIALSTDEEFQVNMQPDLLRGVNTISNENLTAIPYYAWSNRGVGKMKVWLPTKKAESNTD